MKTLNELLEENEKLKAENAELKNKILVANKLNDDACARAIEASNTISYYETVLRMDRYNPWK